jgi:ATP synthase F1 epsilon subunit
MTERIRLRVVTPDGARLDEEVTAVTARSEIGEFCVLPAHRPILAAIRAGRLLVRRINGETARFAVDRGFFEGGLDHVNVITGGFAAPEDLDAAEIEREAAALEERLVALEEGDPAREGVLLDLEWAGARLELSRSEP